MQHFNKILFLTLFVLIGISDSYAQGLGSMIWCKNRNSIFRHQVGTTPANYQQAVNTCSDYGAGVTDATSNEVRCVPDNEYTVAISSSVFTTCLNQDATAVADDEQARQDELEAQRLATAEAEAEAERQRQAAAVANVNCLITTTRSGEPSITAVYPVPAADCSQTGRVIEESAMNDLDSQNCLAAPVGGVRVLNTDNAGPNCAANMAALGIQVTRPPSPVTASNPQDPSLDKVTCAGVAQEASITSPALGEGQNANDPFNFGAAVTAFKSAYPDSDAETLEEQGNEADGYFFKSDLLVNCENLGTEPWGEFRKKVNQENTWAPSWHYYFKQIIGLQDSDGNTSSNSALAGIEFDEEEVKFLQRCASSEQGLPTTSNYPKVTAVINKVKEVANKGARMMDERRKLTESCEALVHLTERPDYSAEFPMTAGSDKTVKKSFDQRITCEAYGAETQDYKACTTFINTYDASMVAKTALNAGQGIHYQGQSMDRQSEMTRQGQTGGVDHRGVLGAQQSDIKDRAGYATQSAALDSAKLATLFTMLQAMPTRAKLKEECSANLENSKSIAQKRVFKPHDKIFQEFMKALGVKDLPAAGSSLPGDLPASESLVDAKYIPKEEFIASESPTKICSLVVSSARASGGEGGSARSRSRAANASSRRNRRNSNRSQQVSMAGAASLIMNDAMRSVAKQILAQTAVEAAANFMKAGMLNKQADKIDELLKKIEGYDPSGDFVPPTNDLLAGPCAFDPSAAGCAQFDGLAARQVGFGGNTLSLGGGGFGTSGMSLDADTGLDNAATNGAGDSDRSDALGPVGSLLPGGNKAGGFESGTPGAASVKTSAATRSNAGGSGGASAVGSTGGSAGGGSGSGAKGGQANAGKRLGYANSSIGRLSGGRGVGRKPASKDGGANPFANMFKKGGPQNDTLNFRNPAGIGTKTGNIFDQISSRYQVVQSKNLLLEYEEKKQ